MNKTITANLASLVFYIDEGAYEVLLNYINEIRVRLAEDDSEEIMQDIEARIAELLMERKSNRKEVINTQDVAYVIETMGSPTDFGDETMSSGEAVHDTEDNTTFDRRIFRDEDNEMIGGVCAGLGSYFGIDPTWIRVAFLLMFFLGGTGILLYLILWLIIPKAKTTAEKIQMKGEPVNAQSIKEHLNRIKEDVEKFGRKENARKFRGAGKQIFEGLGKLFGIVCIVTGFILLSILLYWIITKDFVISLTNTGIHGISIEELMNISLTSTQKILFITGIILVSIGPIIGMFSFGFRLFFKIQHKIKAVVISAVILTGLGIAFLMIWGIDFGRDRSSEYSLEENIQLADSLKIVHLNVANDPHFGNEYKNIHHYFFELLKVESNTVYVGWPKVDIIPSETDQFELIIHKSSNGRTQREAIDNARSIHYGITIDSNVVTVDPYFYFDMQTKYKLQDINVLLKVPNGKSVILDRSTSRVLHSVDNEFKIPQHQMAGKTWTMRGNKLSISQK